MERKDNFFIVVDNFIHAGHKGGDIILKKPNLSKRQRNTGDFKAKTFGKTNACINLRHFLENFNLKLQK